MPAEPAASDRRFEVTGRDSAGDVHVFRTGDLDRAKMKRESMSRTLEDVEMVEILYRHRPAESVEKLDTPDD